MRWFAPNAYAALVVPELRRRGLDIALEGNRPARVAFAMGGGRAEAAWRYARTHRRPLLLYLWDLPPRATGRGRYDPVWWVGGRFVRLPRLVGRYGRRSGYYSRLRYIAARAAAVWVPSELTRDTVAERFGVSAQRVAYCYDSTRFVPMGARSDDGAPTLLTVSRLQPHKNQASVLRAAARLGPEVQVRLVGRGPDGPALARLASDLGVRCRVETDAPDEAIVEAYRRARVVVCPSRFEGFGLTPVEAIATGTPTVVSDIPPHREFVGGAAELFPLDDEGALVGAIRRALDGPRADPGRVRHLTIPAAAERFLSHLRPFLG